MKKHFVKFLSPGTFVAESSTKEINSWNNKTLIWNMETNKFNRIVTNNNSWKWTQPLRKEDVVLDFEFPEKK